MKMSNLSKIFNIKIMLDIFFLTIQLCDKICSMLAKILIYLIENYPYGPQICEKLLYDIFCFYLYGNLF